MNSSQTKRKPKLKRNAKQLLAGILALVLMLTVMPISALAAAKTSSGIEKYSTIGDTGLSVTQMKQYTVAPDITEYCIYTNNEDYTSQTVANVMEVANGSAAGTSAKAVVGYGNLETNADGTMDATYIATSTQAKLWESTYPDDDVVGAINAAWFNTSTGEPSGTAVINGYQWKESSDWPYFATFEDGSCAIEIAGTSISDAEYAQGSKMTGAVAGPALLVENGEVNGTSSGNNGQYPRTALGLKSDGTIVLLQADGSQSPRSIGFNQTEEAEMLVALGCDIAIQFDEGGSSTFLSQREGEDSLTMRNTSASGGGERPVSSTVLIVSNAVSEDNSFDHANITPNSEYYTPESSVGLTATGIDDSGAASKSIPEDITWEIEDSSMGEIIDSSVSGNTATATFISNGTKGEAVIDLIDNAGNIVGTTSIYIQDPQYLEFDSSEINLSAEDVSDLGLKAIYENEEVHMQDTDIEWTITYDESYGGFDTEDENYEEEFAEYCNTYPIGSFDGLLFYATDDPTISCTVKIDATYTRTTLPTVTTNVELGKQPTIVLDGGDEDGRTYNFDETHQGNSGTVGSGEKGVIGIANFGRKAEVSASIVEATDPDYTDIIRFGEKAVRIDYDWENITGTDGAALGTGDALEIPGSPTALGVWVYYPDASMPVPWMRCQIETTDADGNVTTTLMNFDSIYQVGWNYLTLDLTGKTGSGLQLAVSAMCMLRAMVLTSTGGSGRHPFDVETGTENTNVNLDYDQCHGWFLVDNYMFIYGSSMQDTTEPNVDSLQFYNDDGTKTDIESGAVVESNTLSFYATYNDNEDTDPFATGVENVYYYIDGNMVDESMVDVDNLGATLKGITLANGQHTLMLYLKDGYGNVKREYRTFIVDGDEKYPTISLDTPTDPEVNTTWSMYLNTTNMEEINDVSTSITISKCSVEDVVFTEGVEGTTTYDSSTGVLTIDITNIDSSIVGEGEGTLAEIFVSVPKDSAEGSSFNVQVTKGNYTYTLDGEDESDDGYFSTSSITYSIVSDYVISIDTLVVGTTGNIYVNDSDGSPVEGMTVYIGDEEIGKTDANGMVTTEKLTQEAGSYTLYASDSDDHWAYMLSVTSYDPIDVDDASPYYISLNASEDESTEQNITWLSSAYYSNDLAYIKYSTNKDLSDATTFEGTTKLITYSEDSKVARVNNVQMSGLTPDTTYYFVVGDGETWSDIQTFTTDEADTDSVSFFVMADIQDSGAITGFQNISSAMKDSGADYSFGIQLGDSVDNVRYYSQWADALDLFTMDEYANTDWLHVLGNHEMDDSDNGGVAAKTTFGTIDDWYSMEYGDVYIAVLNFTVDSSELQEFGEWLVVDSAQTDCLYKILVTHVPIYYTNPTGQGPTYQSALLDYIDEAGIDFCLSGNDHSYARTAPMTQGEIVDEEVENEIGYTGVGTVYYICGTTGGKSYTITENDSFNFRIDTLDFDSVYLDVTADKNAITLTAYNVTTDDEGNVTSTILDQYSKEVQYCDNDDHVFTYNRDTDMLHCQNCPYKNTMAKEKYSGWVTDEETGLSMYFVAGNAYTANTVDSENGESTHGILNLEGTTYYFDEDGLAIEGTYTIHGETCYFVDGVAAYSDNEDVVTFGFLGDDVMYIIYSDGSMYVEGSGDIWDFADRTYVPFAEYKTDVTSVVIDSNITRIGDYTFRGCTSLTSVTFENGSVLESIGYQGFDQCRFTEITIPATVTSIGDQAFAVNSKLRTIYIPDDSALESIGSEILYKSTYATISIEIDPDGTSAAKQYAIENDIPYVERIDNCTLALSADDAVYTGSAITPAVTIMYNGKAVALEEGTDYTVTYTNNVNVGTATVTVTGINGYTGTVSTTFAITLADQTLVVNPSATNVSVGDTIDINAAGIGTITYKSSDTSVATVDSNGIVTAVNPGTATITVTTSGDANHAAATETISITVNHLGCTYNIDDLIYKVTADSSLVKEVEVIGGVDKHEADINIPASVTIDDTTFIIVGIGNEAFEDYTDLMSIAIGSNVVRIGDEAFSGCTKLSTVTGCIALKTIGEKAFYKCTMLKSIDECSNVTTIGKKAFAYDSALERVGTADGVTSLDNLKSLGSYAFYNCSSITAVKIPAGVTSIGDKTFTRCTALTKVTGCSNITKIGKAAFYKCTALTSIANATKVTSIGSKAFSYDIKLTKIGTADGMTTLNSLKTLGSYAFYNCKSLTAVKLPSGVTEIGAKTFVRCTALTKVTGCTGLKSIGSCAFYKCTSLVNVNNSSNVTTVGSKAFAYCSSLKRVGSTTSTMSLTSLKSLGSYAFYHCTALTAVKIPSTLNSINEKTFVGCTKLAKVTGCANLTSIGSYAFYGCSKLASVSGCTKLATISQKAFAYCSSLKRIGSTTNMVTLPKVQKIGAYAFYHCTSLKTVKITSTALNSIGKKCFAGDSKLSVIRLDTTKLTSSNVGSNAFKGISKTATFKVPSSKVKAYTTILQAKGASKNIKVKGI